MGTKLRPGEWPVQLKIGLSLAAASAPALAAVAHFVAARPELPPHALLLWVGLPVAGVGAGLLVLGRIGSRIAALARRAAGARQGGTSRRPEGPLDEIGRLASLLDRWREKVRLTSEEMAKLVGEHTEAMELQRSVLDNAGEYAILSDDLQGRVRVANAGAAAALGLSDPADALGRKLSELLAPGAAETAFLASIFDPPEKGREVSALVRFRRADGSVFPANVRVAARLDRRGASTGRVYVFKDVSREMLAERRYRDLLYSLQEPVYVTTRDGRFVEANEAMARLLGCATVDEVLRMRATELYESVADRSAWVEALDRSGRIRDIEVRIRTRNGEIRHCIESARTIRGADGKAECYLGTLVDITDRRRLQERLEQTKRIEAMGALAGGLAHDFNNILGAVIPNADLIERHAGSPEEVRARARTIRTAAERAGALARQLLGLARKGGEARSAVSLNLTVLETVRLLEPGLPAGVRLETRLGDAEPFVLGDPTTLQQVIVNLVVNARDALEGKGRILVSTGVTLLDEEFCRGRESLQPGSYAFLSVADDGCGMTKEQMERIFDPFYTTKGHTSGTGLGLAVVYSIVNASGGSIAVTSAPGRGSRFDVHLPEAVPDPKGGGGHRRTAGRERALALVVDPDPGRRAQAADSLRRAGWRSLEAAGREEAARLLQRRRPEIAAILLDASLAEVAGDALAAALDETPSPRLFPMGAIGPAATADGDRAEKGLLSRPPRPEELSRALGGGQAAEPSGSSRT